MNICMICPEIGDAGGNAYIGGHVNNVLRLSKELSKRGHKITIITTPHRHPGNDYDKKIDWAEVISLPINEPYPSMQYGLHYMFKTLLTLRKIKKYKKFDIIHGHSGYSTLGLITGLSGKIHNVPTVHSIYCPVKPTSSRNFIMIISNRFLSKFYLSQISKIVAVSHNSSSSLVSCGIRPSKIERIPPSVDTLKYRKNNFKNNFRKNLNLDPNDKLILYIGNLTKIKGIHILLEAFRDILLKFKKVKLLLVLNMPICKYLNNEKNGLYSSEHNFEIKETINKYGLSDYVIPMGLVDNLPEIMASCDVFVTPFLNTVGVLDYPLSLLEAMSCGLPVIATNVGGIPEIIQNGENGFLINPNDVNGLRDALSCLLKDEQKARTMGNNAASFVSSNLETEIICKNYENIYRSLLI